MWRRSVPRFGSGTFRTSLSRRLEPGREIRMRLVAGSRAERGGKGEAKDDANYLRSMPQQGVNAITVPGAVDGWQKLADKFGRKKLAEDLAAAIRTAQDGFPVPEWTAAYWAAEADYLRTDETAAKTYLPGDRAPKVGEVFRNPELAWSLEQIAQHGRDAFYKGEIAAKIVESMKRHVGAMTTQELSEYSSEFVEPISITYRDWTVYELPPNVQGIAALEMLNIMETFPLGQKDWGFASTNALHTMIGKKVGVCGFARSEERRVGKEWISR